MNSKILILTILFFVQLDVSHHCLFAQESSLAQKADSKIGEVHKEFRDKILSASTIVFLGDSNTNAGEYINVFETALMLQRPKLENDTATKPTAVINLGLPSETCCGLSEPIHPFPRPNVHERLTRALERTKPDLVFSCYGMNDGIYHPFSDERFDAFKNGTLKLIKAHADLKIPLILMTPPPFDPLPMQKSDKLVGKDAKEFSWKNIYKNYDSEVIEKYAKWMLTLDKPDCLVIDIHSPIAAYVSNKRKDEPNFAFSKDGVHFDKRGHHLLANTVLNSFGFAEVNSSLAKKNDKRVDERKLSKLDSLLILVRQRHAITHPAWLTKVGHVRPGVKPGLPMEEALKKTAETGNEIQKILEGR